MYAAMGAPYAGFGTSIMVDEAVPQEGAPSGPASAQPAPAPAPAGSAPTGNGLQSGTAREVPLHMQQTAAAQQAMTAGGLPWMWIAAGVGVTAFALWAWSRRSRAR